MRLESRPLTEFGDPQPCSIEGGQDHAMFQGAWGHMWLITATLLQ
jgi:hypothetical protein